LSKPKSYRPLHCPYPSMPLRFAATCGRLGRKLDTGVITKAEFILSMLTLISSLDVDHDRVLTEFASSPIVSLSLAAPPRPSPPGFLGGLGAVAGCALAYARWAPADHLIWIDFLLLLAFLPMWLSFSDAEDTEPHFERCLEADGNLHAESYDKSQTESHDVLCSEACDVVLSGALARLHPETNGNVNTETCAKLLPQDDPLLDVEFNAKPRSETNAKPNDKTEIVQLISRKQDNDANGEVIVVPNGCPLLHWLARFDIFLSSFSCLPPKHYSFVND